MENQNILKFFLPVIILAIVVTAPTYNFLAFLQSNILESHWSIYTNELMLATLMMVSFILFAVFFIISMKFIEKLAKEVFLVSGIIIIGFCCIFAGLGWAWEIYVMVFIITSCVFAFIIPIFIRLISNKIYKENLNKQFLLILPISSIIWVLISITLLSYSAIDWRILYFISGTIIIFSSGLILLF